MYTYRAVLVNHVRHGDLSSFSLESNFGTAGKTSVAVTVSRSGSMALF